jgi:hypothetical protein
VDHRRLRFTMDRRHGRPQEPTGAQPSATPRLKVAREGAGEVEEAAVSTFVGSSELGRWGNGGVVERDDRRWSVLGGAMFQCGRGGERGGEGCGIAPGWRWPFIGSRGVWRGGGYRQEMLAVNGGNDARV